MFASHLMFSRGGTSDLTKNFRFVQHRFNSKLQFTKASEAKRETDYLQINIRKENGSKVEIPRTEVVEEGRLLKLES